MSATPRALARTHAVRGWRERLAAGRAELRRAFEAEDRPHPLLRDHTRLADDVLTGLWIESGLAEPWALVAVGGFGRGELFPHSDVDILILLPDDHGGRRDAEIEAFVGALWDCGLDVGQSVRTVA